MPHGRRRLPIIKLTNQLVIAALLVLSIVLSGCTVDERPPIEELLPPQIGSYIRTNGPATDSDTGVNFAEYQGPDGTAILRIKSVGKDQISHALSQLPPSATDVRIDPGLGQRVGSFFSFASEFHAAWGNGDWVFILSTPVDTVRTALLANYEY